MTRRVNDHRRVNALPAIAGAVLIASALIAYLAGAWLA